MFDRYILQDRLVQEFNYTKEGAMDVINQLMLINQPISQALEIWLADGTLPSLEIEGFTAERLMAEFRMNIFATLLTLDSLSKDPSRTLATLKKGVEKTTF